MDHILQLRAHPTCDGLHEVATKLAWEGRGGEVSSWADDVLSGAAGPELYQL